MGRRNYSGYLLQNRTEALQSLSSVGIIPRYDQTIFEHVTHCYPDKNTAPAVTVAQIVGYTDNDAVQALLVSLDGTTLRPHGGHYHLTLSVRAGHAPKESNLALETALQDGTLQELNPIEITLEPF